jgi:hypothetical protein
MAASMSSQLIEAGRNDRATGMDSTTTIPTATMVPMSQVFRWDTRCWDIVMNRRVRVSLEFLQNRLISIIETLFPSVKKSRAGTIP